MGTISPVAVHEFLNRDLDDWDWLKRLTRAELWDILRTFHPVPQFVTRPRKHQLVAFILGVMWDQFLFFLDAGTGKTKLLIDILEYRRRLGQDITSLVLVPNVANIDNWVEQVETHAYDLKVVPLFGSSKARWAEWDAEPDGDLYIVNYQGLQAMVAELVRDGSNKRRHRKRQPKLIRKLGKRVNCVILDESQNCKNHQSVNYSCLNALSRFVSLRYGSTGTPFGKNPLDLWSQFKLVDSGETLSKSIGVFQNAFFTEKFNGWSFEWKFLKRKKKKLNQMLRHRSISYEDTECGDLPPNLDIKVLVPVGKTAAKYYKQVIDEAIDLAQEDVKETKNSFIRMRQITSGFLGVKGEQTGAKFEIAFPENPKVDQVLELLDEFPIKDKVIIFHEYIYTGKMIAQRLKKEKIRHVTLNGQMSSDDQREAVRLFKTDPRYSVLVANWRSGGTGLNLQIANRVIYVESPVSPIHRRQSFKRVVRIGQNKHTFIYDIVAKGSADEKILASLKDGRDLQQDLLGNRRKRMQLLQSFKLQGYRNRTAVYSDRPTTKEARNGNTRRQQQVASRRTRETRRRDHSRYHRARRTSRR